MNATILRQVWSAVEDTQAATLVNLDDSTLIDRLIWDLQAQRVLEGNDIEEVSRYLRSRISLIRDLADGRVIRATS
ncbi:hypothetical protein [Baaleninema sp.]|uniref:hypothetical protein n=1 Tax=Baaleninema sp. TaxID=3101197 RepID=UPI003D094DCB